MASSIWWPLLIVLFILGIFFNIHLLSAFALMLAVLSALARFWQRRSLLDVTYRRSPYYRRGFPGENVQIKLEAENRKFLPLSWLLIRDPWPRAIGPEDEGILLPTHIPDQGLLVNIFSLRWFERARRIYSLLLRKRGVYAVGPAEVVSGDLFGIFEKTEERGPVEYLTVFPTPLAMESLPLPAEDPFGEKRARRRLFEDLNLPMGVREYEPHDDFRRVHWPATAHTGELQVKIYQPTSAQMMIICLNVSTFQFYWQGVDPPLLEHLVSATASVAQQALQDGYRVGLLSNGCLAHSDQPFRVPPNRSREQLAHILGVLAGVTPFVSAPFERLLLRDVPQFSLGAMLFVITCVTNPELNETLLRLKSHGRRITLLSFARNPPDKIPGIKSFHSPYHDQ